MCVCVFCWCFPVKKKKCVCVRFVFCSRRTKQLVFGMFVLPLLGFGVFNTSFLLFVMFLIHVRNISVPASRRTFPSRSLMVQVKGSEREDASKR